MALQSKLDETQERLGDSRHDFNEARKSHNATMEKLKQENEAVTVKLDETLANNVRLENRIEELKLDLTNVRESLHFQRTPSIFDAAEFLSPSFDEDSFYIKENEMKIEDGPTASTPFLRRVRGSISDEIKN